MRKDYLVNIMKYIALFLFFGCTYFLIETIWKGHLTHYSMLIVSGVIGVLIGEINNFLPWEMSFWIQCLIGAIIATAFEGLSGLILNVWLGLGIWDYSNVPFAALYNQICLPFSVAWYALSGVCIVLDDYIRYFIFNEEKPHYNFRLK